MSIRQNASPLVRLVNRSQWMLATGLILLLVLNVSPVVSAPTATGSSEPAYQMTLHDAWITMPDGVKLAADLYLPTGGDGESRFPVLLEYLPYRKNEYRDRNHRLYGYFVERGYAVVSVDIRGTGNSEGRLVPYEYSDQEWADGDAVLDWLAEQPWSTGNLAMFGISWGGFNAIQMAGRGHPALKTIIAVDATEDLYQEDVHYIDGIMHLDSWEMAQELYNAMPGAPDYVIDDELFENRFDTEPWVLSHKRQQRDGPHWDRGSWRDRHHTINIPTFHIGGWYDGYRNSLPRMLEMVTAPVKAIIGPWSHAFPHDPYPEPGMEWRHEAVRWFDHWLKGVDTGIMDEPAFAVYVRQWHPPGPYLEYAPGYWRWEAGWPIERTEYRTLYPQQNHDLATSKSRPSVHHLRNLPTTGVEASGPVMWWGDVAPDQRPTDAFSLVYDSAPLAEPTEILGRPETHLQVAADAIRANWFVRLSDVAPDGTVTQVAGAGFNGTHRISAREPQDLVPGEFFPLDISMHFTSWVFPPGHRIRLSISNAQWPMFWPTPLPVTTALQLDASSLQLPVIPTTGAETEQADSQSLVEQATADGMTNAAAESGVSSASFASRDAGTEPTGMHSQRLADEAGSNNSGNSVAESGVSSASFASRDAGAEPTGTYSRRLAEEPADSARSILSKAPNFLPPQPYPGAPGFETLDSGTSSGYGEISSVDRNPATGEVTVKATNSGGTRYPWGVETYRETIEHRTSDSHPEKTAMLGTHSIKVELEDRELLFEAELDFSSDAENFYYRYFRRLTENGKLIREKHWEETIARDYQ